MGPLGIKHILDAVALNEHVDRFLLGNNIITDDGAKVIADFILDERSKRIYNFYVSYIVSVHYLDPPDLMFCLDRRKFYHRKGHCTYRAGFDP